MTGAWIVAAAAVATGPGQDQAAPDVWLAEQTSGLDVTLLPGAWFPRLGGKSSLGPPGTGTIQLGLQLDLDDLEPSINEELSIRKQEVWELIFSGVDFSTDSSGQFPGSGTFGSISLNDGDPFQASFDLTSFSAELAASTFRPFTKTPQRVEALDNRNSKGTYICDLRIAPSFGIRHVDVVQTLESGGSRESAEGEWLGVLGGLQVTLDYYPDHIPILTMLRLHGSLGVGPALGGEGGFMWQVRGGLTLQVTEHTGVMIGYRLLELDVETDDYSLDGGLQGLFLAGFLRF